jgi:2-polyprenyl-6-methoxyphenol hydroxylase-like FAD-dependent oxidoreductase
MITTRLFAVITLFAAAASLAFPLATHVVVSSNRNQASRGGHASFGTRRQHHFRKTLLFSTTKDNSITDTPTQAQFAPFQPPTNPASHYDAIVAGGGPAALMTAIMLSQKFGPSYSIAVCERRAAIPPSPSDDTVWSDVARFYLLGIGHRGQSAMERFGVLPDFIEASVQVEGRRNWEPGMTKVEDGVTTIAKKDPPSRVLARDKLVGVLHEHLVKNYIQNSNAKIDLLYGYEIEPISFATERKDAPVKVRIRKCEDVFVEASERSSYEASQDSSSLCNLDDYVEATTDFLVGADGATRTVARAMEAADAERYGNLNMVQRMFAKRPFKITRFEDDNPRVYKSVPIFLPADWPRGLNYSARSRNSRITLEALPSDDKGSLCALLLMKPDDELAQSNVDPRKLRQFFDEEFPQFGALISDEEIEQVALKPSSRLPVFRYAGPRLNLGFRTLILGDAAHTVKPYYGLGANTALEDVQVLSDILDEKNAAGASDVKDVVPAAVQTFSDRRSGDAEALVTISRNMDRPGKLFIINFLLPIILDGIFHKIAPKIVSLSCVLVWSSCVEIC